MFLVVRGYLPPQLALTSALSASIAGIITIAIEDGRAGIRLMLRRLMIWRVKIGYWLFALFFLLSAVVIGSLFNPLFNEDPVSWASIKPTFEILPFFVVFFIVAGIGQELGWTGFLTPRLQARYSALVASLLRALLIAIWHLPLLFYARHQPSSLADFPYGAWIAQSGFIVALLTMILLFLIPWSIFFTWIFNNTRGSLLLVAVLHASEVWLAHWMLSAGINSNVLNNYWGYGAIFVGTALILVLINGSDHLSRKYGRIIHPP